MAAVTTHNGWHMAILFKHLFPLGFVHLFFNFHVSWKVVQILKEGKEKQAKKIILVSPSK